VRRKAQQVGQSIADATADARTTAAIKAKLVTDKNLSALNISVNTTDGVVTLSGVVSAPDDIGKAMVLAMEVEGVREVISTVQVKPKSTDTKPKG
jgi:osmotically-inducible protein OsmY